MVVDRKRERKLQKVSHIFTLYFAHIQTDKHTHTGQTNTDTPTCMYSVIDVWGCDSSLPQLHSCSGGREGEEEQWGDTLTSPHQLPSSSCGRYQYHGSLLPTTQLVNDSLCSSVYNISTCTVLSPHVMRESPDFTGHSGRLRSPSPMMTDDDSVHDADFNYQAEVELEARQPRRYGPSSDSKDGEVPTSPPRKQSYRQLWSELHCHLLCSGSSSNVKF